MKNGSGGSLLGEESSNFRSQGKCWSERELRVLGTLGGGGTPVESPLPTERMRPQRTRKESLKMVMGERPKEGDREGGRERERERKEEDGIAGGQLAGIGGCQAGNG
jgi:hypothetical protein